MRENVGADDVDVTSDVDVESVTLADGNNNVEISYGGKTANLVVQAKTQDAYDVEAAEAVGGGEIAADRS